LGEPGLTASNSTWIGVPRKSGHLRRAYSRAGQPLDTSVQPILLLLRCPVMTSHRRLRASVVVTVGRLAEMASRGGRPVGPT